MYKRYVCCGDDDREEVWNGGSGEGCGFGSGEVDGFDADGGVMLVVAFSVFW